MCVMNEHRLSPLYSSIPSLLPSSLTPFPSMSRSTSSLLLFLAALLCIHVPRVAHAQPVLFSTILAASSFMPGSPAEKTFRDTFIINRPGVGNILTVKGKGITQFDATTISMGGVNTGSFNFFDNPQWNIKGVDFSGNALQEFTFPPPGAGDTECNWCNNIQYLDLSNNQLTTAPPFNNWLSVRMGPPGLPQTLFSETPNTPGHLLHKKLTYWDMSNNPLGTAPGLPTDFGKPSAHWFELQDDQLPTFKCKSCSLTTISTGMFARQWQILDLSENSIVDGSAFGHTDMGVYELLDLSHNGMTTLSTGLLNDPIGPGPRVLPYVTGPPHPRSAPYTAIINLSHNNFATMSAANTLRFGQQFDGTLDLSYCQMTKVSKLMFDNSRWGNLILTGNDFGEEFNLQNARIQSDQALPLGQQPPTGVTGNVIARSAGITKLKKDALAGFEAYSLDLTANEFVNAASWEYECWNSMKVTKLILNRCKMTDSTLLGSNPGATPPDFTPGNSFHNVFQISELYMTNDGSDSSMNSWNKFTDLPNQWLVHHQNSLYKTLTKVHIGQVTNIHKAFFRTIESNSVSGNTTWIGLMPSLDVIIDFDASVTPLAATGPVFNLMTGYESIPVLPRTVYNLDLRGAGFSVASVNTDVSGYTSQSRHMPQAITMPLDPAFLQSPFFKHFPRIPTVTYAAPSTHLTNPTVDTPWASSSFVIPTDLIWEGKGIVQFGIVLNLNQTPRSPVNSLDDNIFLGLRPIKGEGSLLIVDLSSAQLGTPKGPGQPPVLPYASSLFAGLTRSGTKIYVDVDLLYAGDAPVPVGLFDGLSDIGISTNGKQLQGNAQLNKALACHVVPGGNPPTGECGVCESGSFLSSVSGYYYCSVCTSGNYCTLGTITQCPAGQYQPLTRQSACVSCPVGTYNSVLGQSHSYACIGCAPGTYNPNTGASSSSACIKCPAGSVNGLSGGNICNECPRGTYADTNQYTCVACPANTYMPYTGSHNISSCLPCPGGKTSPSGSYLQGECVEQVCLAGERFDFEAEAKVTNASTQVAQYCIPCDAGYSCLSNRAQPCLPGSYSLPGQSSCSLCPVGTYNANSLGASASVCLACPIGTYNDKKGAASCISCPEHTVNPGTGKSSADACVTCIDPVQGETEEGETSNALCTVGAAHAISLTDLLPSSSQFVSTLASPKTSRSQYSPIRGGDSLRLTADRDDSTLAMAGAGNVTVGAASNSHSDFDPEQDLVLSDVMFALMVGLIAAAVLPILLYRLIPLGIVDIVDQMALSHKLLEGGILVRRPTKFGAAFTISFVFIAIYFGIRLGTAGNATLVNTLQPASSHNRTGQAIGAFELTIRAFGAPPTNSTASLALNKWCHDESQLTETTGFKGNSTTRTFVQGSACVIFIDCLNCGMSGQGAFTITLPYVNQLIEWEVWATAAVPGSWSRFTGAVSQLTGQLLDKEATLHFSAIEAFFRDTRKSESLSYCGLKDSEVQVKYPDGVTCALPTAAVGAGFEMAFGSYETIQPQLRNELTDSSKVKLSFRFDKQDVVYSTTVTEKLGLFQILSSILATVVSLLSVFMLVFQVTEHYILRRMKISSCPTPVEIHVISKAEIEAEEKAAAAQEARIKAFASGAVSTAVHAITDIGSSTPRKYRAPTTPRRVTVEPVADSAAESQESFGVNSTTSIQPSVAALLVTSNAQAATTATTKPSGNVDPQVQQELDALKASQAELQAQLATLMAAHESATAIRLPNQLHSPSHVAGEASSPILGHSNGNHSGRSHLIQPSNARDLNGPPTPSPIMNSRAHTVNIHRRDSASTSSRSAGHGTASPPSQHEPGLGIEEKTIESESSH